jgi:chemotaxis protein MotB
MKKPIRNIALAGVTALIFITSCVPARQFEDMVNRRDECENRAQELSKENENYFTQTNELRTTRDKLQQQVADLRRDTTDTGTEFRKLRTNYEKLSKTYEILLDQNEQLMKGRDQETRRLLSQLHSTQGDLNNREDELRRASAEMLEKEKSLNALNERLTVFSRELSAKEQRVNELEKVISRQDSVVRALRRTVSNALLGFEGQGLTIEIKNGKVYVSMEESLLFASGSTTVDPRGVNALRELAKVLAANPDINVLIEGHTDDVPLRAGGAIKDNWDLSVLRATAIVRILLQNNAIDSKRLTAAGRGEFMPLDPARTQQARRKNRRTEIILTPRLDDLFQIIDLN